MRGKTLISLFAAFVVVFVAALWWFQTRAYYETVEGVESVEAGGAVLRVSDYRGIDAVTSPLKLRACFRVSAQGLAALAALEAPKKAEPLTPPGWFDCFDAETIEKDIEAGRARAVVAARDQPEGFDRMIAWYPDGRAYLWRQLNDTFAE